MERGRILTHQPDAGEGERDYAGSARQGKLYEQAFNFELAYAGKHPRMHE
jgi:hypothetical protein